MKARFLFTAVFIFIYISGYTQTYSWGPNIICDFSDHHSYGIALSSSSDPNPCVEIVSASWSFDPPEAVIEYTGGGTGFMQNSINVLFNESVVENQGVTISVSISAKDTEGFPCGTYGASFNVSKAADIVMNNGSITGPATISSNSEVTYDFSADVLENTNGMQWLVDGGVVGSTDPLNISFTYEDNGQHVLTAKPRDICSGTTNSPSVNYNFTVDITPPDILYCDDDVYVPEEVVWPNIEGRTVRVDSGCVYKLTSRKKITINPGLIVEPGATFELVVDPGPRTLPDDDENMNWKMSYAYDGEGNVIAASKSFADYLGRPIQGQSRNFTENHILASEPLYDEYGNSVGGTLPAPIFNTDFNYQEQFVTNPEGETYDYEDFDTDRDNPAPVGKDFGTVGWFYSSENDIDPFMATTDYPYARSWSEKSPDPKEGRSAGPGDEHRMGAGHESIGTRVKIEEDPALQQYYAWRQQYFVTEASGAELVNTDVGYKNTATNSDGRQAVSYTDAAGRGIIAGINNNGTWEYAYSYLDDAGRLIASIPPEGVASGDPVAWASTMTYNHQGWLLSATSVDEGMSEFVYSDDGKIRFSQNMQQRNSNPPRFSYTLFDRTGRLLESGEYTSEGSGAFVFENHANADPSDPTSIHSIVNLNGTAGALDELRCHNINRITYDLPDPECPEMQYFIDGGVSSTSNDKVTTWYSYDHLERLIWMIQDIEGLGQKKIAYEYDFNGNVLVVRYQPGQDDAFNHYYEYDADMRLSKVYTGTSDENKKLQATYYYYLHGPLRRVELGDHLQGIDYVYTPQGWLKGINHGDLNNDPGLDGQPGEHQQFLADAFGMTLEYYDGTTGDDYTGAAYQAGDYNVPGSQDLFSGAIKAQGWHNGNDAHQQVMYGYNYDDKMQLLNARWGTVSGSGDAYQFNEQSGKYALSIPSGSAGYDKHGNIQSLVRKDKDGDNIANYEYEYENGTNKLTRVNDNGQQLLSYEYNDIGQMTAQHEGEKDMYIRYNPYGLVTGVYKNQEMTEPIVLFDYDDKGNRLAKRVFEGMTETYVTWYVRDLSGTILSVYEENKQAGTPLERTEVPVYGGSRIGMYMPKYNYYTYELKDHLGNVRAVLVDNPKVYEFTATMEYENETEEEKYFYNLDETRSPSVFAGNMALVNQAANGQVVGPAIAMQVVPGDVINMEVSAYCDGTTNNTEGADFLAMAVATTFGYTGSAETQQIFDMFGAAFNAIDMPPDNGDVPAAYLTYLFFDNNMELDDYGWSFISDEHVGSLQPLEPLNFVANKPGFLYIYVANETVGENVYFDNLSVTLEETPVVVSNDYYPFGMPIEDRSYERSDYRFDYQGQFAEKDDETGYNAFQLRMYDARIGRWISPDPMGQYASPYVGMGNSPTMSVDPDGGFDMPTITLDGMTFTGKAGNIIKDLGRAAKVLNTFAIADDIRYYSETGKTIVYENGHPDRLFVDDEFIGYTGEEAGSWRKNGYENVTIYNDISKYVGRIWFEGIKTGSISGDGYFTVKKKAYLNTDEAKALLRNYRDLADDQGVTTGYIGYGQGTGVSVLTASSTLISNLPKVYAIGGSVGPGVLVGAVSLGENIRLSSIEGEFNSIYDRFVDEMDIHGLYMIQDYTTISIQGQSITNGSFKFFRENGEFYGFINY